MSCYVVSSNCGCELWQRANSMLHGKQVMNYKIWSTLWKQDMKEITISLILRTMNGLIYSPYYSATVYYMLIHPPWKLYEVGFQPTMIEHEVTLIVPPTFGFLESNLHSWNEIVPYHAVNWSLIEHKPPCYLWFFWEKKI